MSAPPGRVFFHFPPTLYKPGAVLLPPGVQDNRKKLGDTRNMIEQSEQLTVGQTGQAGQTGYTPPEAAKAVSQTAPGLPPSIWDNLPEESDTFVKFTQENNFTVKVRFIDNEPKIMPSKFEREKSTYEFEVIDLTTPEPVVKTWGISSVRLMRALKEHTLLDGKAFQAIRTGEGMKIDYILTPIV